MSKNIIDERLKDFATTAQIEYIDAVNETGSYRKAEKKLGIGNDAIRKSIKRLQISAAKRGYSPDHDMVNVVPEPFVVRGTSTLYDENGNVRLQWVKSKLDDTKVAEAIKAAVEALSEGLKPAHPIDAPLYTKPDLCNLYVLTDCHVGARSWGIETGADWDLDIAEDLLIKSFNHLVRSSPPAHSAIVAQLGDWLHFDGLQAITPTSGHILDGDGRYSKVVKVAINILRNIIDRSLEKHSEVIVLMAEGNHDMASSVWLRHLFSLLYSNDPRIKVIDSELPYYVHTHGETMLCFHHGHLLKNSQLPGLMAAQFPKEWGSCTRRYCHTGHRHHVDDKEHPGIRIVQHSTIAARDSYAARGGCISDRQITSTTYHVKYGQVATNTIVPEML